MDDAKGLAGGARGYGEVRGHRSGPGRRHTQVTQELPLIGAHFLNVDSARDGRFDPTRAELLIYAYEDGDWRFYGPSYITSAGRRLRGGGAGGLRRPLRRQCSQRSGFFIERMGHQMHLWVRENPSGMFNQGPSGAAGLRRQKRQRPAPAAGSPARLEYPCRLDCACRSRRLHVSSGHSLASSSADGESSGLRVLTEALGLRRL